MRKTKFAIIGACFASSLLFVSGAQAKTWTLNISTGFSSTSQFGQQVRYYFDNVAEHSGGRIKVKYYYGGSLAKIGEELNAMRSGAIDGFITSPAYYSAQVPLTDAFNMTFITSATDAAMHADMDVYNHDAALRDEWEKDNNTKILWWPPVTNNTLWSTFPVPDIAALKGKKIRAQGRTGEAITKLGGVAVGLKWNDIYTSVQRGIISGAYSTPLPLGWDSKFQEVMPYITQTWSGVFGTMAVGIRKDLFDSFPADLQKVFLEWAPKAEVESLKIVTKMNHEAVDNLVATGKTITIWSNADRKKAKALIQPAQFNSWIKLMSEKGMGKEATKARDMYMAAIKKYEPSSTYQTAFDYYLQKYGHKK